VVYAPKTGLRRLPGFRQSGCKDPAREDHLLVPPDALSLTR